MKLKYERNKYKENSYLNDLNNEIKILKLLSGHKNSVKYYGNYDKDNLKVLIVEKCDENMEQFMKKRKKELTIKEIKDIFIGFNEILYKLQEKKIIHRDLKLSNLLIKYDDKDKNKFTLKLSDFGISKIFLEEINYNISGYKFSFDTAAPEIILKKIEKHDSIVDIFSLGIIFYQLSHNLNHPFIKKEDDYIYFIYRNYYDEDNFEIEFNKSIENDDFKDLIRKMLRLNPKNRLTWDQYFEHKFFK